MSRTTTYTLATLLSTVAALPVGAQTIAITGGKVFPVSSAPIENGTVLIRDGRIVAVGANVTIPADARRIDASGKWVTPGLVHGYSGLGVHEIGLMPNTVDRRATGKDHVAASFPVWEGINPASVHIPPARNLGVTTVGVVPQGGLIAGQAAVIDLLPDRAVTDLLIKTPAAIAAQIGDAASAGASARGEQIARLRAILTDARSVLRREAADTRASGDLAASRRDLAALAPVLEGRIPLYVTAERATDIEAAVRLAQEFKLRLVVTGAAEGWQVAKTLASAGAIVLTGASNNSPISFAELGGRRENAGLLRAAGVTVGIIGEPGTVDPGTYNAGNIRYEAGMAVAAGMTWDDALRAVTLSPAEALGVADRVGSLAPGRQANVVVWTGDPFEFASRAETILIRGEQIKSRSRRDDLMHRYKTLPPNYRLTP